MKNVTYLLILPLWLFYSSSVNAQSAKKEVTESVQQRFDAMYEADTSKFRSVFHHSARFLSTMRHEGKTLYEYVSVDDFVLSLATVGDSTWKTNILSETTKIDENIAMVWMDYEFFVKDKFIYSGINMFVLIHTESGWKITEVVDTRKAPETLVKSGHEEDLQMSSSLEIADRLD